MHVLKLCTVIYSWFIFQYVACARIFFNIHLHSYNIHVLEIKKSKAILVKGRGGPKGCETSRLLHFVENLLTDGIEVVSLTRRLRLTTQEDS
jgi:hypothetical protein